MAILFKTEVEKVGHKCWIDISAQNKSTEGIEGGVCKCDIAISFFGKFYLLQGMLDGTCMIYEIQEEKAISVCAYG